MALFGWGRELPSEEVLDARAGADALLQGLDRLVPKYLEKADRGELVYPACKRKPDDASSTPREIWRHTRLEGMRYLTMIPGRDAALLTEPSRQAEMIDGFLRQQPHENTVVDFTGRAVDDVAIAIIAGLNWLNHCALLVRVDRTKSSGTLRNFRKVVLVAQQWWSMEGAEARCRDMQQARELPPLMIDLVWLECTHLAKDITAAAISDRAGEAGDAQIRFEAALDPDEPAG
jgi:hypothetical protein